MSKQGKPVAEVVIFNGFKDIRCNINDLEVGDLLYTSAPTIPEGWQLVPIEPPDAMGAAFHNRIANASFQQAYKDMLSAAPKPEDVK